MPDEEILVGPCLSSKYFAEGLRRRGKVEMDEIGCMQSVKYIK